ncbi:hypothetical protein SPBR_01032 [Sporothrix brasiliensis 5110]|uniref:MARVEL domain-containing protein n=1 Tax=Sporothrix brasiliensis 5110 TaxID=1398154 RepID=A0A0C2IZZ5_9PEZI|nr:uncharacterized protein SPBR_01032 [Sporothrix brasiliensis 5110]KIH90527.1 hypothetical protein SPBR_01032 [Sporothrix brasiliensis 5110]
MLANIAASRTVNIVLRSLQVVFAIVVLGTDGYVHAFRGHTVHDHFAFGDFTDYVGVPSAWGFLLFCAGWTVLGVLVLVVAAVYFAQHRIIGYVLVAVEAVALLSWLAGFVAVAVNIGTNACPLRDGHGCGSITAAAVFGGLEWLLFAATTAMTVKLVLAAPPWSNRNSSDNKSTPTV